jgi:hypothetical protein
VQCPHATNCCVPAPTPTSPYNHRCVPRQQPQRRQAAAVCEECCGVTGRCSGGGKFLALDGSASQLRVDFTVDVTTYDASFFTAYSGISGALQAFNYESRTLIETTTVSYLDATLLGGGDFSVTGAGVALVNGVATNIIFDIDVANSVLTFLIAPDEEDTETILAAGTEEAGRAAAVLTIAVQ